MLQTLAEYWWAFLLRGILAVLFGIAAFVRPGPALLLLVIFFGAYALVEGIISIIAAFGSKRWGLHLFHGIISVAAGLVTFFWPDITAVALIMVIGIWAMFGGVAEVVAAIQLRKVIENEWLLGISGVFLIGVGIRLHGLKKSATGPAQATT